MSELKPCPFCGGDNLLFIEYKAGYGTVGCGDCCFEYPDSWVATYPKAEAIEAWNTRHERTCSPVEPFDSKTKHIVERGSNHYYWPYKGCPECQCDFPQGSNFCPNCGTRIKEDTDAD